MPTRSHVVRVGVGLLLLVAAGLKLSALSVSTAPQAGWFAHPTIQLLTAEWELVLGLWLLSNAAARWAWLTAIVTFTAFAGVSGYLGWVGVASCGWLGAVETSPWWTFGVDVLVIGFLAASRPRTEVGVRSEWRRVVGGNLKWVCGVGVLLATLTVMGAWYAGSPIAALARLRGESVSVSNSYVDFGAGHPGDQLEATITVYNWTEEPVRIIGGTSDCSCTALADLPSVLGADFQELHSLKSTHHEVHQCTACSDSTLGRCRVTSERIGFRSESEFKGTPKAI